MVDLAHPAMQPRREPLRSLIYAAAERAVAHVIVAGKQVVKNGRVLTMDYAAAAAGVNEAQQRALVEGVVARLGRPVDRRTVAAVVPAVRIQHALKFRERASIGARWN